MPVNPDARIPEPPFTTAEAGIIGDTIGILWDQVEFSVDQFLAGLQVELEHGTVSDETDVTQDDPYATGKIAWAHLKESPDYYEGLAAMEKANQPAAPAAVKDEGAVPMSPDNMAAPMDATTQTKSATVEKSAVVKRCRPTDCPDKPEDEKRWCLLTHDEKKALKCAPSRQEAAEHEKNVNFFKQGDAIHYQGTCVDIDYEPRYTVVTAASILRDAAQGRDVDDMDIKWDDGAIPGVTKSLDSAAIKWVQSEAFPQDDETFEMLDPVTDDRALPAKPDEYYPVFIKFCERYGLDVEDLEKRWGGRSIDHRLTAVARDFAHKIVPACTEQSRVCQDVGGSMAFAFVSRIPGVIYIAAETEGKQQFNFKPQLTRQYRDDKPDANKTAGAKRTALIKRNRDLRVAVLVNVKSMWNPKFAEALQRSLTNLGDEPGQHPLDADTLEAQVPDTEVAREALNLYYTVWAATMETLYNFGKKVGNDNVLNVTTARLSAAITDQAFGASSLMPAPPAQNLPAEYKQFLTQNKLTKGFDVNQIVQWATGTAGKTYKQWEKALTDRWKQEKPADKSTATPPPVPGQGATPPPVPQDAKKQKQGKVKTAETTRVYFPDLGLAAVIKVLPESQAIMDEMAPHERYNMLVGDAEQFSALKALESVVQQQKLSKSPRGAKVKRTAIPVPLDSRGPLRSPVMTEEPAGLDSRGPLDQAPMAGDIGSPMTVTNQMPQGVDDPDVDLEIVDLLLGLGAQHDPDDQYTLMTPVGPLYCRVGHDALYCRFRDIEEALEIVDCDAHSGEWNQYYFDDESPEKFVGRIRRLLDKVMQGPAPMVQVTSPGMADMMGFGQPGPMDPDLGMPMGPRGARVNRMAARQPAMVRDLIEILKMKPVAAEELAQAARDATGYYGRGKAKRVMELANSLIPGATGVESIRGALYINMGETYAPTFLYDTRKNRFMVERNGWGTYLEYRRGSTKTADPEPESWDQSIEKSSKSGMAFFSNDDATYVVTPRGTSWIIAVPGEQLEEPIKISAVPEDAVALTNNPVLDRLLTRFPRWYQNNSGDRPATNQSYSNMGPARKRSRGADVKPLVQRVHYSADLGLRIGFVGDKALVSTDDGAGWTPADKVDWDQVQLDCTAHRCEQFQEWPQEVKATFRQVRRRFGSR